MKKILSIACALAVWQADAQTNLVKISQLPTANPLTGTELFPLAQSGATVNASLNQLLAPAEAMTTIASNFLAASIASNTAVDVAQGAAISANAAVAAAALVATNAALQAAITASNGVVMAALVATNVVLVAANGATMGALAATNAIVQNQFQQTNAVVQAALAALGGIQAGGSVSFKRVSTPTYTWAATVTGLMTPTVATLNAANGSFQRVTVQPAGTATANRIVFIPSGLTDGDNVYLEVVVNNGMAAYIGTQSSSGIPVDNWSGATAFSLAGGTVDYALPLSGATKTALLNWQVIGGNVVFSVATHP